jgi:lipase maturation factor 1
VCYLAAFLSLAVQVQGLVGSQGILPARELLDWVRPRTGLERYWIAPTLFWLADGDLALTGACVAGAVLSGALLLGLAPIPTLGLLWALYLSLSVVGQVFLGYQWDALLLETGLLAVFLAPGGWRPGSGRPSPPSPVAVWLLRWLLFRLMFSSGVVKLASGDQAWRGLTALGYHYWSQPLPTWIGWYAAHLPAWVHSASVGMMFAVELLAPLLLFARRRFRRMAFGPLLGLQVLIALTGNYAFFNLLATALCLFALEDADLPAAWGRASPPTADAPPRPFWPKAVLYPLAAVVGLVSGAQMLATLGVAPPGPLTALHRAVAPLSSINGYGLFAVMTTTRPEIIVEGSDDGRTWKAYELPWKPGELTRRPGFVAPHQPRLDWQMWFAALGTCETNPWLVRFLGRLLEGSPTVVALLARNPFPDRPPRFVRAELYDYEPTDLATKRREGTWWRREARGDYCPALSAEDFASRP